MVRLRLCICGRVRCDAKRLTTLGKVSSEIAQSLEGELQQILVDLGLGDRVRIERS